MKRAGAALLAAFAATGAGAQTVPLADTEDATLSAVPVGTGAFHPIVTFDLRNGDYARGAYDDDDAGLGRVPVHVAIGFAAKLARRGDGQGALFLIGQSSNGFHAARAGERTRPRGWYESNNLLGLAWRPHDGLTTALTYTIKASPNGVAATTHEASASVAVEGEGGVARLRPKFAATLRPRGDGGVFTTIGIGPEFALADGEDAPTLSLPIVAGVGWGGFYGAGSGDRLYGSGGVSLARPLRIGAAPASISLDVVALVRDDRLRRMDAPGGTTAAIVPLATLALRSAW